MISSLWGMICDNMQYNFTYTTWVTLLGPTAVSPKLSKQFRNRKTMESITFEYFGFSRKLYKVWSGTVIAGSHLPLISKTTEWEWMLGMATIMREVRMSRISVIARPSRRMLMELTMAGLTKYMSPSPGTRHLRPDTKHCNPNTIH